MRFRPLRPPDRAAVDRLLARRTAADGRSALSEHKALRVGGAGEVETVAVGSDDVVGYAHTAHHPAPGPDRPGHWATEVVPAPGGDEEAVTAGLIGAAHRALPGDEPHTVWLWRPADRRAAARLGLRRRRRLFEMRRPLPAEPPGPLGAELRLDRFRPERDEDAWLAANNAAFAGHPENGALDRENLAVRMSRPWFDPQGFLLARRGEEIVGFCWTKRHDAVGEIYIIGVVPSEQGSGLGRTLLLAGLEDLAVRQGAQQAMLYADGDDARAVTLYEGLGFAVTFVNEEWGRPDSPEALAT